MRRLLVILMLLVPALAACGGPAGDDRTLVVLGPWPDLSGPGEDEHDTFKKVLDAYGQRENLTIEYQGTRAVGQALAAKAREGALPDIAILPSVGELAAYATPELAEPVTAMVSVPTPMPPGDTGANHRALWRGSDAYAVAVKTDLKSLVIHREGTQRPGPLTDPATLSRRWCLGLSAASAPGWPGTDWIEDLLLQQTDIPTYEKMASGTLAWTSAPMVTAWTGFGRIVKNPRWSLLNSPEGAADDLAQGARCTLLHQSSFYTPGNGQYAPSGQRTEVSGDFAARFTKDPLADALLRHLAEGSAWVTEADGGMFPVDPDPARYTGAKQQVATALRAASSRCLDASDAMPPAMASAFQSAVLEFVADEGRLRPGRLQALLRRLDAVRDANRPQWIEVRCAG